MLFKSITSEGDLYRADMLSERSNQNTDRDNNNNRDNFRDSKNISVHKSGQKSKILKL